MKFKTIFLIFNVIIIISFIFFFTMPLFVFGFDQFIQFLGKTWITLAIFVTILGIFNAYFIVNWNFFHLLEREDWNGLIRYMETKIYKQNSVSKYNLKILINSYICTSNIESIKRLREYCAEKKPGLISHFAIQFGIPYLLDQNAEESRTFFGKLLELKDLKGRDWITWNYAISLMQLKQPKEAKELLSTLLSFKHDHIVYLLSLYMLNSIKSTDSSVAGLIERSSAEFRKNYSEESWYRKVEGAKTNIEVLSLASIIKDATVWIFQTTEPAIAG